MTKIMKNNGQLTVPDKVTIPYIEGDGVGQEITPLMCRVVDAAVSAAYGDARKITWMEVHTNKRVNGCHRLRSMLSARIL